jgi:mRNA interferase MazF
MLFVGIVIFGLGCRVLTRVVFLWILGSMDKNNLKEFQKWSQIKAKLDSRTHKPPFVKVGQIWWAHYGENIGVEISGKGDKFFRPVVIHTIISRSTFLVIPLTSKADNLQKYPKWYFGFEHKGSQQVACLGQIKVIDYARLYNLKGEIDDDDLANLKLRLLEAIK